MASNLTRWDPMGDMVSLRDAMDRLLSESIVRPWSNLAQTLETSMPLDMYEENDQLVVKTSMPGVKPEDVSIEVRDDILTITGEVKSEASKPGDGGSAGQSKQQPQTQGQTQSQQTKAQEPQAQAEQKQGNGQKADGQGGKGQNWYLRERVHARYVRSVTLPFPVQADKAEATMENGVLTLRLPKAEQAKAKKIQVKAR